MLFKKKKKDDEAEQEDTKEETEEQKEEPKEEKSSGDASLGQLVANLDKLKAQFSTFYEMQKAATERFTRLNEQIGELRAMILNMDKNSKMLEAKALQAIDMVQTVQPDRFMIELRKSDGKIEALRASLESNEVIVNNAISELKEMRNKIQVFRGMEQVVKLNEEVKSELMEIKKQTAVVERHADRVETIFLEMQKRFSSFDQVSSIVTGLDKSLKQMTSDMDSVKVKMTSFANKKDVEDLITKFNNFEKHVSGLMSLINKKFENLEKDFRDKFEDKMDKTSKLLKGFEVLAQKTPDLNKYFGLLEKEANKAQSEAKVEKIKVPGEEEKEPQEKEKKPSLFGKLKSITDKVAKKD